MMYWVVLWEVSWSMLGNSPWIVESPEDRLSKVMIFYFGGIWGDVGLAGSEASEWSPSTFEFLGRKVKARVFSPSTGEQESSLIDDFVLICQEEFADTRASVVRKTSASRTTPGGPNRESKSIWTTICWIGPPEEGVSFSMIWVMTWFFEEFRTNKSSKVTSNISSIDRVLLFKTLYVIPLVE